MIVAANLLGIVLALVSTGGDEWVDVHGHSDNDDFSVDAYGGHHGSSTGSSANSSDPAPIPSDEPEITYCWDGSIHTMIVHNQDAALDGVVATFECPDYEAVRAAIEHEWSQLKPIASTINLQPNTGWVIATVPTVAMAADARQTHQATLLGYDVTILATASGYEWDWGDGSSTRTDDPGSPYPHASVTHTYPHAAADATVALTTTWTGQFRIGAGPWVPFDTSITSTSSPVDLVIYDPRSRLVNCDLDGQCHLATNG